jgi:hypothetical protein
MPRHAFAPLFRLSVLAALVLLGTGCGLDNGVGQQGQYTFLTDAPVVDSVLYSLEHLMIVEQDQNEQQALVYLFSGELGKAGLGVADLRRIAQAHGRFKMAFDPPRSRYAQAELTGTGTPLMLRVGGSDSVALVGLNDADLVKSGASRWLGSVSSDDYGVRAYFAVVEYAEPLPALAVELDDGTIEFAPQVAASEPTVTESEDGLTLAHDAAGADYVLLELWQAIASQEMPELPIEAAVRMSLAPGVPVLASGALLTDAAGQGCWSLEVPIAYRITQVARELASIAPGPTAFIHERADAIEIDTATWTGLTTTPVYPAYCDDF